MKSTLTFLFTMAVCCAQAQIQTGVWRNPTANTDYNQFIRNGTGAALFVNQVANEPAIMTLSSGTAAPSTNIRFVVANDGSTGIGIATPTKIGNFRLLDIIGKSNEEGGMLRLATLDGGSLAKLYNNSNNMVFELNRSHMSFQWISSAGTELYSIKDDGSAKWNAANGVNTLISSTDKGQYMAQLDNNNQQNWIVRGYQLNGVQASFNLGGIDVKGRVRATEVKVESSASWPDYVFEEGYKMKSLSETEAFIKTNKHLPGIPNQKQVEEEGVNLGEMNRKLLEKVEELTLHLIEKEKEVSEIKRQLMNLSTEVADLKKRP